MGLFGPNIRKMKQEKDIQGLIETLRQGDTSVRTKAALALGEIRDEQAVPALIEALEDHAGVVRQNAVEALGKVRDKQAVPALIKKLDDDHWGVREKAVLALGAIGGEQSVSVLIEILNDEDWQVRWRAAEALGKSGDGRAVPALIKALNDQHSAVREGTAWALGQLNDKDAIEPLEHLLKKELDGLVTQKAIVAIERIKESDEYKKYLARTYELAYRLEDAAHIYEGLGMLEKAGSIRKLAQQPKAVQQQIIAGNVDMSTKTEIKNSVLTRSPITTGPSSEKPFSICPYCGEKLNLPETPNFCPYCEKRLKE